MLVLLFVSSLFDDDVFFERFGGISLKLSLFSSLVVVVSRAPTLKKFFKKCSRSRKEKSRKRSREKNKNEKSPLLLFVFSDTNYMSIGIVQIVSLKKLSGRCLLRLYIYIYIYIPQKVLLGPYTVRAGVGIQQYGYHPVLIKYLFTTEF